LPDRNSKPTNIRTVLVLEGDVPVRMPIVQLLRECGYRVVEAATTDQAIAILESTNIPVEVVLSEIDIPGSINGFGFAQWARSVARNCRYCLQEPQSTQSAMRLSYVRRGQRGESLTSTSSCWIVSSGCSWLGRSSGAGGDQSS
jgi:CheY-like chemotaxis protein